MKLSKNGKKYIKYDNLSGDVKKCLSSVIKRKRDKIVLSNTNEVKGLIKKYSKSTVKLINKDYIKIQKDNSQFHKDMEKYFKYKELKEKKNPLIKERNSVKDLFHVYKEKGYKVNNNCNLFKNSPLFQSGERIEEHFLELSKQQEGPISRTEKNLQFLEKLGRETLRLKYSFYKDKKNKNKASIYNSENNSGENSTINNNSRIIQEKQYLRYKDHFIKNLQFCGVKRFNEVVDRDQVLKDFDKKKIKDMNTEVQKSKFENTRTARTISQTLGEPLYYQLLKCHEKRFNFRKSLPDISSPFFNKKRRSDNFKLKISEENSSRIVASLGQDENIKTQNKVLSMTPKYLKKPRRNSEQLISFKFDQIMKENIKGHSTKNGLKSKLFLSNHKLKNIKTQLKKKGISIKTDFQYPQFQTQKKVYTLGNLQKTNVESRNLTRNNLESFDCSPTPLSQKKEINFFNERCMTNFTAKSRNSQDFGTYMKSSLQSSINVTKKENTKTNFTNNSKLELSHTNIKRSRNNTNAEDINKYFSDSKIKTSDSEFALNFIGATPFKNKDLKNKKASNKIIEVKPLIIPGLKEDNNNNNENKNHRKRSFQERKDNKELELSYLYKKARDSFSSRSECNVIRDFKNYFSKFKDLPDNVIELLIKNRYTIKDFLNIWVTYDKKVKESSIPKIWKGYYLRGGGLDKRKPVLRNITKLDYFISHFPQTYMKSMEGFKDFQEFHCKDPDLI